MEGFFVSYGFFQDVILKTKKDTISVCENTLRCANFFCLNVLVNGDPGHGDLSVM